MPYLSRQLSQAPFGMSSDSCEGRATRLASTKRGVEDAEQDAVLLARPEPAGCGCGWANTENFVGGSPHHYFTKKEEKSLGTRMPGANSIKKVQVVQFFTTAECACKFSTCN